MYQDQYLYLTIVPRGTTNLWHICTSSYIAIAGAAPGQMEDYLAIATGL